MVSSLEARQIFEKLKEDPENNKCIECDRENPTFASINNGCLMCPVCVQSHTALGVQISRIKSISGDWTLEDLKLMTAGGNSSLKVFFDHYNITNTPPNFKYLTRASFFYREMLAVVAQDQEYQHNCPGIVDHAADSFAKQATYTYNTINANPSVQKLKADTMNVLREIGNKIKKTFESENPKAPNEPYVAQV